MAKDSAINDIQGKHIKAKLCLHCWKIGDYYNCGFYPIMSPQIPDFQFTNKCTPDDWKICPFK